jgi:hypothetical protein
MALKDAGLSMPACTTVAKGSYMAGKAMPLLKGPPG